MRKIKWNIVVIMFTFSICMGVIGYTAIRMSDNAVVMSNIYTDDFVLIFDAGHGGIDGGCSTSEGEVEKNINLNIVLSLNDLSKFFGYNVEMTRKTDKSIHDKGITGIRNQKISDMKNRLELFNKYSNAICISIHQNTFSDSQFNGAQMFYSDKNTESERLASLMQEQFVNNLQPNNQREIKLCGEELYLCYFCTNPTVMVECGFLSNPTDADNLTDANYQKKVAFTVFSGINKFINV